MLHLIPNNKQSKSKNRTSRQERGRSQPESGLSTVMVRTESISSVTQSAKPVTRTFHYLNQFTCGTSVTAPTVVPLSWAPPVSLIKLYDRYLVKKIKVHVLPNNTSTGGALCIAYDATEHSIGYPNTNNILSLNNSMVVGFSPTCPEIVNYVINRPGYIVEGAPDLLRYDPVGTGVAWKSGQILVGSMLQANIFTVWIEYEVELIAPRDY